MLALILIQLAMISACKNRQLVIVEVQGVF